MASPLTKTDSDLSDSGTDSPASPSVASPSPEVPPSQITGFSPSLSQSQQTEHPISPYTTSSSSTPLSNVNAARRPGSMQPTLSGRGGTLPPEMEARMKAFQLGRQGTPPISNMRPGAVGGSGAGGTASAAPSSPKLGPGGVPSHFRVPPGMSRPGAPNLASFAADARVPTNKPSLAQKRGMLLPSGLPDAPGTLGNQAPKKKPGLTLSQLNSGPPKESSQDQNTSQQPSVGGSLMEKYAEYLDTKSGSLKFKGKAILTNQGVEFSSGTTFSISLDEVDTLDELGKGNYGTVYKVRHSRPRLRRPGQGLAGNKSYVPPASPTRAEASNGAKEDATSTTNAACATSGVIMGMKEIRLELEDAKFAAIIMELDILHRCISPYIIDFYGAFFQEGAVYICMEFMDGGSIDKLYADGIPEKILQKITLATTMGLKSLKDEHNIIHRDVKPTNILVNTNGQVKICDFGVSGNLVASIAKTNIGCQSYMAPERISNGGVAQAGANPGGGTYSVQSDIWSLGLTIIECALGQYPYPPETYDNIFSQLSAIVDGEPPDLPPDRFSEAAREFVRGCLMKIPKLRPTYSMLLQHAWLAPLVKPPTITEEDEEDEMEEEAKEEQADSSITGGAVGDELTAPSAGSIQSTSLTKDREVAEWVMGALERRRNGVISKKAKPALHAAPLDAVGSPSVGVVD